MATFLALSPPLGSRQSRQAPDLFSIELELLLPDDHFLPAQNIVAQVWTNLIHRLNPDGPETWAALPMKLSHVSSISSSALEGGKGDNSNKRRSVAVFATRIQPTGRGDFGLTARWKAHTDLTEWQWAPTAFDPSLEGEQGKSAETKDGEAIKNRDVAITVRVPRSISGTSSWTMGPQSVLVYGQHGPRLDGLLAAPTASVSISPSALAAATTTGSAMAMIGGPGLYLGNHAAATRARISGYEAVLSLVGDLLDFDERIPESDKEVNKNAWLEQAKAKEEARTPPKRFSVLSRSSSVSFSANGSFPEGDGPRAGSEQDALEGLRRRSSVSDFMARYEPGMTTGQEEEEFLAGVVNEPEEGPRLTRKTSVTEMMVQIPVSSSPPVSKRLSRASYSLGSIGSIAEQESTGKEAQATSTPPDNATTPAASGASTVAPKETLHTKASSVSSSTNGNGTAKTNPAKSTPPPTSGKKGSNTNAATTEVQAATTSTTATAAASLPPPAAATSTPTPPLSKKEKAKAAAAAAAAAASTPANAASLPPVSSGKTASSSSSSSGRSSTGVALSSPTVASLGIGRAFPSVENSALSTPSSSKDSTDNELETTASKASKTTKSANKAPTSISTSNGAASNSSSPPPSSASVMSTLTSSFSSSAMISSLAADSKGSSSSSTETSKPSRPFSHKVISLPPGAHNKISDAALKEAVTFLMDEISQGKKVLVHCRDGHGRSGSVAIAYIVAREQLQQQKELQDKKISTIPPPSETYEAALNEVWRWKCDVYPHKGLRQSLERIQWESKA
ncbi:hypothetical protein EMPS_09793 [Entomortierella parvispora]|uniref:Tyrosine specific protein phosphatases domain-containing protein n=1 Tax=Entomortierella parvispora TaxID=205924 RepID=A0A9P3HIN0_9FUNG|nr:hypothetical protein EMPS_09793 [Entomortierella parvispora]